MLNMFSQQSKGPNTKLMSIEHLQNNFFLAFPLQYGSFPFQQVYQGIRSNIYLQKASLVIKEVLKGLPRVGYVFIRSTHSTLKCSKVLSSIIIGLPQRPGTWCIVSEDNKWIRLLRNKVTNIVEHNVISSA